MALRRTTRLERRSRLSSGKPPERGQPMKRKAVKVSAEVRGRRKFVASLPCLVCGRVPSEPHHVRPRQMGGKRPDSFDVANLVSLCADHHRLDPSSVERMGRPWFEHCHGLDLEAEAKRIEDLYQQRGTE